ncbi:MULTISPECIES: imm11 family protein [unclassified Treponema]|uniref:imm11 family protein n=1 Tax=unclassified Treponema TaxID=2638727 RepID=UPI0032E3FB60
MRITNNGITQNNNVPEKVFFDYQYNQFAYYLLSERLKNCIEENKGSKDSFSWIKVSVSSEIETRNYYIPIFERIPDVLDSKLTTRVPASNAILVPCFASEKLEGHNFFPLESSFGILPRGIYVSEALKKILQKQKFDNIKFEKAKCSLDGSVIP